MLNHLIDTAGTALLTALLVLTYRAIKRKIAERKAKKPKAPPKAIPKQADVKTFILWALVPAGIGAVIIALAAWGISCLS